MTKRILLAMLALGLLTAPFAAAHGAPQPREFQTRLLADCEDDVGGDGAVSDGYDIHNLDLWEAWDGARDTTNFRVVMNGAGDGTVTIALSAGGADKFLAWESTDGGDTWTTSGFASGGRMDNVYVDNDPANGQDGDRFALEGTITSSQLGGTGAKLMDYTVTSETSGRDDSIPGNDAIVGGCVTPYERPDYTLKGPMGYASLTLPAASTPLPNEPDFVDVQVKSLLQKETQEVTLRILAHEGTATVQFHDPADSDDEGYSDEVVMPLGKRGGAGSNKIVHLAIEGPADATGTVQVELTTDLGGRAVETIAYTVGGEQAPPTNTATDTPETQDSPGVGALAALGLLAVAASRRP